MRALVLAARDLNVGFLGCYGSEWVETPALDRLAAGGVVFDLHHADTLGTPRSALTGRAPLPGGDGAAMGEGTGLARLLQAEGVGSRQIDAVNLAEAGPAIMEALAALPGRGGLVWADLPSLAPPWRIRAKELRRYFDPGEEDDGPEPLTAPPVGPFDREDFVAWEGLRRTYAAAVTGFDRALGEVVAALEGRGVLDDTLLVVTAERGLALGEHGAVGPWRPWLHEELVHLPLLMHLPGGERGGGRVAALTQPADLFPTLAESLGVPCPPAHGYSLWPLLRGEAEQVRAYACSGLRQGGAAEAALRSTAWAFLLPLAAPEGDPPRAPRLYVKPDDRWEVNDVRQHHLELADHMEAVLRGYIEASRREGPLAAPELKDVEAELTAGNGPEEGRQQEG
jgi:arylsulfatase A-like enzyme